MPLIPLRILPASAVALVFTAFGPAAYPQQPADSSVSLLASLPLVHGDSADRIRLAELAAGMADARIVLRSPSHLTDPGRAEGRAAAFSFVVPQVRVVSNSALPFSVNDGPLWAGRGISVYALAGLRMETRWLRVILAPEVVTSENREFQFLPGALYPPPPLPAGRSPFGFPWYAGRFAADLPLRFGAERVSRWYPGQSSITLQSGRVALGMATENEWWGPGIRNAIVLSSSAPGFPHAFLRTRRPLRTPLGDFEGRWLAGGLRESDYFDTSAANDVRPYSAAIVTLRPWWEPNLVLGAARAVYASGGGWGDVAGGAFNVFRSVTPAREVSEDSAIEDGRDNIMALFARWVLPRNGFEAYGEWARTAGPRSLRDFLLAPNHTHGYTIGFQWHDPAPGRAGALRLQGEITTVEKSPTFRDRPSATFYISPVVPQGYTQHGQPLGAFIGPGASSQWIAADYVRSTWQAGAVVNRIRWNEDIRAVLPAEVVACVHDVSLLFGPRFSHRGRMGSIGLEALFGTRQNAFWQKTEPCPGSAGTGNSSLTFTWSAPVPRR